jgi:hypothetical protein
VYSRRSNRDLPCRHFRVGYDVIVLKPPLADDPSSALAQCGTALDEILARRIVAHLGAGVVPPLCELAESDPASDEEYPWQRVHSVRRRLELGIEETFDRLIRIFLRALDAEVDDSEQWEAFLKCCPALGRPFLDRVFNLLEKEPQHTVNLACLVYGFDRDPRIEALLDTLAETEPETAAELLCSCKDPPRLPIMFKTLENLVRKRSEYIAMLDLADAIEKLGGHSPQHVTAYVAQVRIACHLEHERRCLRGIASGACRLD